MIEARYQIPAASPGAMLREERRTVTALGMEADKLTRGGQLLPDPIILRLVQGWFEKHDGAFTLDGFPRTLGQAEGLQGLLTGRATPLEIVLSLEADLPTLQQRVQNRLVCRKCRRNVSAGLQVSGAESPCPHCGGSLTRRDDDNPEALAVRMDEYWAKTAPLISYYDQRGLLRRVDAMLGADAVFFEIAKILEER